MEEVDPGAMREDHRDASESFSALEADEELIQLERSEWRTARLGDLEGEQPRQGEVGGPAEPDAQ
jgi:hypothetical protein